MAATHSRKKRRMDQTGHFDLVVVGCGGGHDETNLSGYLFKPKDKPWAAGLLGLEAGSGYGALKRLLSTTHPRLFSSLFAAPSRPTGNGKRPLSDAKSLPLSPIEKAQTVYAHLRAYLITHAHLDHAASLVISSGSLTGPTKYILGARGVLEDLERCIWGPGRCWPGIVGWENEMDNGSESGSESSVSTNTAGGILRALKVAPSLPTDAPGDRDEEYVPIGLGVDNVSVRTVPVSHGCGPKGYEAGSEGDNGSTICNGHSHSAQGDVYKSSAFFIRHALTRHEFLFFGDVEADPVAPSPQAPLSPPQSHLSSPDPPALSRPLLRPIWQHTAHLFTSRRLHTLLIECSYPAGRPEAQLYGHLSVEGLRREMRALAQEVYKIQQNKGLLKEVTPQPVQNTPSTAPRRSSRTKPESDPHPTKSGAHRPRPSKRKAEAVSDPTTTHPTDPLNGVLTGLRVIVIHCKDPAPGFNLAGAPTIADFIARQLREGVPAGKNQVALGPDEWGVEYVAAHQGDEFGESLFGCCLALDGGCVCHWGYCCVDGQSGEGIRGWTVKWNAWGCFIATPSTDVTAASNRLTMTVRTQKQTMN